MMEVKKFLTYIFIYLEVNSIESLKIKSKPSNEYFIKANDKNTFDLNKFFYKQIGKKHQWTDRLVWQDKEWINYVSNKNLETYILQTKNELIGYFELIHNGSDCEIAYFGILEEYIGKGLGGFMLSEALKSSFKKSSRVWVHTCSLDHPNAIENYKARGMKVFKRETLNRKAI